MVWPPQITLPGGLALSLGGLSDVQLKTTFLDERVRVGQGSRGSLFIFKRSGAVQGELLLRSCCRLVLHTSLVCLPWSKQHLDKGALLMFDGGQLAHCCEGSCF